MRLVSRFEVVEREELIAWSRDQTHPKSFLQTNRSEFTQTFSITATAAEPRQQLATIALDLTSAT
jgi:hypothetical protein